MIAKQVNEIESPTASPNDNNERLAQKHYVKQHETTPAHSVVWASFRRALCIRPRQQQDTTKGTWT